MSADNERFVRVGTRRSQLAIVQTTLAINMLKRQYPRLRFEVTEISTVGDKILDVALSKIGDKSLFTKELEVALLNKEVDFVVHSLKDVPTNMPPGLVLGCVFDRVSPEDVVLMSPDNRGKLLADLPDGSVVGTSALRRVASLQRLYPKLKFVSIRGNLNTRLKKLDGSQEKQPVQSQNATVQPPVKYDAIVLAKAGIERLGWSNRIDQVLSDHFHAVSQGALACECRQDDDFILSILSTLHHESAGLSSIAERALMRGLDGGCSTPIGVRSRLLPNTGGHPWFLSLDGCVMSLDGVQCVQCSLGSELPYRIAVGEKRQHSVALPESIDRKDEASPVPTKKFESSPDTKSDQNTEGNSEPLDDSDVNEAIAKHDKQSKVETLDQTPTQAEIQLAEDCESMFMGIQVKPICTIARLRMARAEHLGSLLAKRLLASGADQILEAIRVQNKPVSKDEQP